MTLPEIIYLLTWILTSAGLAIFLQGQTKFFKTIKGVLVFFLIFLIGVIFDNLILVSLKIEESVFFTIYLLSFGVGAFLFLIWLINVVSDLINKTSYKGRL